MDLVPTPLKCVMHESFDWELERPKPGDMFWMSFSSGFCNNHEPPCRMHLVVVCPDGHWWNIDSRASNCTMKEDKTHRCWVRHGDPPNITVDKDGATCNAGAGSIQTPGWHGFLRNGELVA
jgi:hypothetical protein